MMGGLKISTNFLGHENFKKSSVNVKLFQLLILLSHKITNT